MSQPMTLVVLTPDSRALDVQADSVRLPAQDGNLGIWPNHAPLIAQLKEGTGEYKKDGQTYTFAVHPGVAQVRGNRVSIVMDAEPHTDSKQ